MRPVHSAAAVAFTVHRGPVKKVAHVVTTGRRHRHKPPRRYDKMIGFILFVQVRKPIMGL